MHPQIDKSCRHESVQAHFFLPFPLTLGDVPFVATLLAREV